MSDREDETRAFLAYSDQNDRDHNMWLAAWRDGYNTAAAQYEAIEAAGYARAVAEAKTAQQQIAKGLIGDLRTWDGPRHLFARPRPGDHPGGPVPPW